MKVISNHLLEKLRASAWTTPTFYVLVAIAVALLNQYLDRHHLGPVFERLDFLHIASVDDARILVSTIATSMLAIAGVSFSSIIVSMTLASQQFGPRILRNFLKDSTSQRTLGVLFGTFVYCLLILRGIQSYQEQNFVPQFSVLTAMFLALVSLGTFIHFIHSILNDIQAESVVADAYLGLRETIDNQFPARDAGPSERPDLPEGKEGWEIMAGRSGYLQALDHQSLAKLAQKYDALLTCHYVPGNFVAEEQAILTVLEGPAIDHAEPSMIQEFQDCFLVGRVRTPEQDYQHGFRQLVEVALRALSPGINDPFTAMDSLDYLGAALQEAFQRPLPPSAFRDESGDLRLLTPPSTYQEIVEASFNQIRQSAVEKCDVSCRLLEVLESTAKVSRSQDQQEALLQQAVLVNQNTLPTLRNDFDQSAITARFQAVLRACDLTQPFS